VHWVLCVYVVYVVVGGFCDKETHGYDLLMLKRVRSENFDSWKPILSGDVVVLGIKLGI